MTVNVYLGALVIGNMRLMGFPNWKAMREKDSAWHTMSKTMLVPATFNRNIQRHVQGFTQWEVNRPKQLRQPRLARQA
ncbi:hypothetical protein MUP01_09535 [Candidatus Bathyarchaeota archaeon]|nr:hypothetical protein [Candidatus Bathyarchaeota archaeon]